MAAAGGGAAAYYGTRYPAGDAHTGKLAIRGATALVGDDLEQIDDAIVLIEDGHILDTASRLEIPTGAEIIDAAGTTVLPGLIDTHVHMLFPRTDPEEEFGLGDTAGFIWDVARYMPGVRKEFLEHGVTTVRDLGGDLEWAQDLRTSIDDGTLEGPRLFFAGPILTTPGGHPIGTTAAVPEEAVRILSTPQDARDAVAELCEGEHPADVIKVVHDSGGSDMPLHPHEPEVLEAIVETAREYEVPVTGHCGTPEEVAQAVRARFDGLEHITLRDTSYPLDEMDVSAGLDWPAGLLGEMAEAGVALDPTLLVELYYPDQRSPERQGWAERAFERLMEAHEAGVEIVAGSDAGMAVPGFGSGLIGEIERLDEAGLPTRDVLRAATGRAAAALRSDEIGVLEPGRAADLLILDGNPLDDLSAIHDVTAVLRDGRMVVGDLREA